MVFQPSYDYYVGSVVEFFMIKKDAYVNHLIFSVFLEVLHYENVYNILKTYELFIYGDIHYITCSF